MWEGAVDPEDHIDVADARKIVRRSFRMMRPYKRQVVLSLVFIVVFTVSVPIGPLLIKYGIDRGITGEDGQALNRAVIGYVIIGVLAYLSYRMLVMTMSRAGEGFLRDLRRRLFDHLQRLSMTFYDRHKAGILVSRMTSDIDTLAELMQFGLQQFVMNVLLLAFSIVLLAVVSWQLLLLCLIALPFVVIASIKFRRDANRAYLDVRDRIGHTLSRLQEGLAGVRVIQAYGREDTEIGRFADENRALYDAHMQSVWVQSWYLPVIEMAGLGSTALIVGVGGWMTINGAITIGTIAFFVLTLNNLFEPVQQLSQLFNTVQSAGAGLKKVFELLDTEIDVNERPGAVDLPERGDIVVDHVTFAYGDGTPVLRDVSLTIASGERLALVGPTGAGKSTLAKLVARFYDPTEGSITFGGVDLRGGTLGSLRERIVVVPQEGFLFNGTIRENVRIARHTATDEEIETALREVGVFERFASLPEGLDTEVRERGSRLSAGEKQLVSLARAALVDPALLVLDEATSSLDPGTEVLVEEAMARLMHGRTVIVIAHRLSTAERADRVGVVADGRLVELDTHDELVANEGHYAELFSTWQGGLHAA
ncbi:MAG: ABC transporter ATP-binding protein [Actinobacteria bacterium]|nr:ABC transporter ATP-binding protein [Actinomycetota bacterium]